MFDKLRYLLRGKPKFCGRCGKPLQENSYITMERFSRKTGKLLSSEIRVRFYCASHERFTNHDCYAWYRRVR